MLSAVLLLLCTDSSARDRKRSKETLPQKPDTTKVTSVVYTDEFLDTVKVSKKILINDYTTVGFQYGVGMNAMSFNPSPVPKSRQIMRRRNPFSLL